MPTQKTLVDLDSPQTLTNKTLSGQTIGDVGRATVLPDGATATRNLSAQFGDVINVKNYSGVSNTGIETGPAFSTLLDNVAAAGGGTLWVPRGTYSYATSPNFARANVNIVVDRGALFVHTGVGPAFILDGGATGSGILGLVFDGLSVQGNSNSDHGIYTRSIHHSRFLSPRVLGCSPGGAAFRLEWCVTNQWDTPRASINEGPFTSIPLYGMYFTRRASDNMFSTTQTITNGNMEGITTIGGAGYYIDYGGGHKINGGTSESNYNGLVISTNSYGLNLIHTLDMESNSNKDLLLEAVSNTFINVLASSSNAIGVSSNPNRNHFIKCWLTNTTMAANAFYNVFDNVEFLGTRTDNSTLGNVYRASTDPGGAVINDKDPRLVVATGSLPAAGSSRDGTILIENVGTGDRNLIIFAGGQRFRIDGGSAF